MVGQMYRHRSDILIVQGRSCPGVQRWSHQSIFTTSTWHDDETTTEWWHYKTLWYIYMTLWHCNNNNKIWHNNDITWHLQYVTMTICPWHYDNASRLHTVTSNYTGGMLTGWRHNHDCGWSVERAAAAAGAVQWLVAGLVPAKHYIIIQSQHYTLAWLHTACTLHIQHSNYRVSEKKGPHPPHLNDWAYSKHLTVCGTPCLAGEARGG